MITTQEVDPDKQNRDFAPLRRVEATDLEFAQIAGMRPADGEKEIASGEEKGPRAAIGGVVAYEPATESTEEISGGCDQGEVGGGLDTPVNATVDASGLTHGTNGDLRIISAAAGDQSEEEKDHLPVGQVIVLMDGGVGEPPDEWRIQEANRRKQVLDTYESLLAQGWTQAKAAAEVGQGVATIWRWQGRLKEKGFNGLLPETERCGRLPVWKKLGISQEDFDAIMREVRGLNADVNSTTQALRIYANSDKCTPELAAVILDPTRCSKHAIPPSLRKAAEVDVNLRNRHHGPRRAALKGIWTPRQMDILPGDIFSSDDTTPIFGFWVPWETSKEYPHGVKLLQGQLLPIIDVCSQVPPVSVLIARETSSYRASDIWHLFGHTFEEIGLPRLGWQLERGSWEANVIRGLEVEYRENEISYSRRVGGLRQLPTNVTKWHEERLQGVPFPKTLQTWTSFLPKSKSIEAWFHRDQKIEGTLWGCLGRDQMRAPMEKAKKVFEACRRGAADPRLNFLSQEELMKRLVEGMRYVAHEPMEGEVFSGVPMLKWEQGIKEYPLFRMPEELKFLYRREWSVVTVTSGWARVRLTHQVSGERYSLFYINPEMFAEMEGKQVAVYYDKENFEEPAQIVAAEDMRVRGEWIKAGDFVCSAQYEERKGSFLSGDQSGHDIRKRWHNAVRSVYATIVKHAPSRQVPAEIAARRAEAKSENRISKIESSQKVETESQRRLTSAATLTIDRRPAPAVRRAMGPSKEEMQTQRNDFAAQAAIAAQLRSLRGEE